MHNQSHSLDFYSQNKKKVTIFEEYGYYSYKKDNF